MHEIVFKITIKKVGKLKYYSINIYNTYPFKIVSVIEYFFKTK